MPRHLVAIIAFAAVGCAEPFMDGSYVVLEVSGSVQTPDGAPVVGATLDIRARVPDTCVGSFASDSTTSGAAGGFSTTLRTWNVPRDVCLWIAVLPHAGSIAAADTVTIQPARLDIVSAFPAVHIVLPVAPGP